MQQEHAPDGAACPCGLANQAEHFYVDALCSLGTSGEPFMVGGAYAMREYAGIYRDTKDLDVFCRPEDTPRLLKVLHDAGYETMVADPLWIAKAYQGEYFVDLIFSSGNGICRVDDLWLEHASQVDLLGCPVKLIPAEELIWSKSFVQHRERYDGADVAHVLRHWGKRLDWERLLWRMDQHWEVLLMQLINFRYVYPSERDTVPKWVMQDLLGRAQPQLDEPPPNARICRGTLLAGPHYGIDVEEWGYTDARHLLGRGENGREATEKR